MAEKEAARLTQSLVALQREIGEHWKSKDEGRAAEAEGYYSEQCGDVVAKAGRSARFAAAVVKSQQMAQVMAAREGSIIVNPKTFSVFPCKNILQLFWSCPS